MVQMYILANKKKAILSFYSSYTHHIEINDFLIGVNAFDKKIYSTYRFRERWVRRRRKKEKEEKREKERKQ
jgi:hypothetical protein